MTEPGAAVVALDREHHRGAVDQRLFGVFAAAVRTVWPLLPDRLRYAPRAYAGVRRGRAG